VYNPSSQIRKTHLLAQEQAAHLLLSEFSKWLDFRHKKQFDCRRFRPLEWCWRH